MKVINSIHTMLKSTFFSGRGVYDWKLYRYTWSFLRFELETSGIKPRTRRGSDRDVPSVLAKKECLKRRVPQV